MRTTKVRTRRRAGECLAKATVLLFVIFSLVVVRPSSSFAQVSEDSAPSSGPRKHLATIIFAGLGGAILGLSTLSFYGRPQDKLGNIGAGFALGVIAGTGYVTYKLASRPREFYSDRPWLEQEQTVGGQLLAASSRESRDLARLSAPSPLHMNWTFEF